MAPKKHCSSKGKPKSKSCNKTTESKSNSINDRTQAQAIAIRDEYVAACKRSKVKIGDEAICMKSDSLTEFENELKLKKENMISKKTFKYNNVRDKDYFSRGKMNSNIRSNKKKHMRNSKMDSFDDIDDDTDDEDSSIYNDSFKQLNDISMCASTNTNNASNVTRKSILKKPTLNKTKKTNDESNYKSVDKNKTVRVTRNSTKKATTTKSDTQKNPIRRSRSRSRAPSINKKRKDDVDDSDSMVREAKLILQRHSEKQRLSQEANSTSSAPTKIDHNSFKSEHSPQYQRKYDNDDDFNGGFGNNSQELLPQNCNEVSYSQQKYDEPANDYKDTDMQYNHLHQQQLEQVEDEMKNFLKNGDIYENSAIKVSENTRLLDITSSCPSETVTASEPIVSGMEYAEWMKKANQEWHKISEQKRASVQTSQNKKYADESITNEHYITKGHQEKHQCVNDNQQEYVSHYDNCQREQPYIHNQQQNQQHLPQQQNQQHLHQQQHIHQQQQNIQQPHHEQPNQQYYQQNHQNQHQQQQEPQTKICNRFEDDDSESNDSIQSRFIHNTIEHSANGNNHKQTIHSLQDPEYQARHVLDEQYSNHRNNLNSQFQTRPLYENDIDYNSVKKYNYDHPIYQGQSGNIQFSSEKPKSSFLDEKFKRKIEAHNNHVQTLRQSQLNPSEELANMNSQPLLIEPNSNINSNLVYKESTKEAKTLTAFEKDRIEFKRKLMIHGMKNTSQLPNSEIKMHTAVGNKASNSGLNSLSFNTQVNKTFIPKNTTKLSAYELYNNSMNKCCNDITYKRSDSELNRVNQAQYNGYNAPLNNTDFDDKYRLTSNLSKNNNVFKRNVQGKEPVGGKDILKIMHASLTKDSHEVVQHNNVKNIVNEYGDGLTKRVNKVCSDFGKNTNSGTIVEQKGRFQRNIGQMYNNCNNNATIDNYRDEFTMDQNILREDGIDDALSEEFTDEPTTKVAEDNISGLIRRHQRSIDHLKHSGKLVIQGDPLNLQEETSVVSVSSNLTSVSRKGTNPMYDPKAVEIKSINLTGDSDCNSKKVRNVINVRKWMDRANFNNIPSSIMMSENCETEDIGGQSCMSDIYENQSIRDTRDDTMDISSQQLPKIVQHYQQTKHHVANWGFSLTDHNFSTVDSIEEKNNSISDKPKNGDILVFDENIGEYRTLKGKEKVYIENNE